MTTPQDLPEKSVSQTKLNPQEVADFLIEHPDFLIQNPNVLEKMTLPHNEIGAISFVQKQQQLSRSKIALLESHSARLMSTAKQNEHIYKAFINLYMSLLECPDSKQLIYLLRAILLEQIELDGMKLVLFIASDEHAAELVESKSLYQDVLLQRLSEDDFYFGRLKKQELALFFTEEQAIKSVSLIRLGGLKDLGILAFGSIDDSHFQADMDTLFLAPMVKLINRLLLEFSSQPTSVNSL